MIEKYRQIQQVQWVILFLNLVVCILKLGFGIVTHSGAMLADGVHALGDAGNNIAGMIGIYFAYQPKDEKHPYGHRKFETFSTLLISAVLVLSSWQLFQLAVDRMLHPQAVYVSVLSMAAMVVSILMNVFISRFELRKARELTSDFLASDARHTLSDVYISLSVLCSLLLSWLGIWWIDTVITILVGLVILHTAVDITKAAVDVLCDAKVLEPAEIDEVVQEFSEIVGSEAIRSRGRKDDMHVHLHISVKEEMELTAAHHLIHALEAALKKRFPGISDVAIHVEPKKNMPD